MNNMYNYILNLFFPKKCINCGRENSFLCDDCLSLIELNKMVYCACPKASLKNKLKCANCPSNIYAVFTIFNEKQKLVQKLFQKSKSMPELNIYFCYLIITHLKNLTNIVLDNTFTINYDSAEIKNIAESLSKFTKIPLNTKAENVLLITRKYPNENILKKIETLKTKKIYVISLFRQIF